MNVFHPGPRGVGVVQNEDGKLERVVVKPPSDPEAAAKANQGEAQSLVTFSIMNAQQKDISSREKQQQQDFVGTGASFQNTGLLSAQMGSGGGDQLSFKPQPLM